jgi:AcrR family transcriptional regulator
MAAATSRRKSAEEQREEIPRDRDRALRGPRVPRHLDRGYRREAGISQPYLFRLFRTKQELFLASDERACKKLLETFRRAAAAAPPGERLQAMECAYTTSYCPAGTRS